MVKISVDLKFRTHVYSLGNQLYRQKAGGPIGMRSTCSISRLVIKVWDNKWLERLESLKVKIEEATRYMDDDRQ